MGFGSGFLLLVLGGFLVLGPKRMHEVLKSIAQVKAGLDRTTREITGQLAGGDGDESTTRT